MHAHRRAAAALVSTLLFLLAACGGSPPPTQTPFIIVVTAPPGPGASAGAASPTAAVTPTNAPTRLPTAPGTAGGSGAATPAAATAAPAEIKLTTYSGSGAPFSVQYPSDWTAVDHEQSQKLVVITAPNQLSSLLLLYGTAGTLSTDEVLQTFLSNFAVPALKTSNQRRNPDGSMSVDLQYNDSTGSPLNGMLRLVRLSTSANFYVIIFSATPEKFAQLKPLGASLLNSFQERTTIVRQPTPLVLATATSTIAGPPVTETPVPPTDTPLPPPPTDTPRPVFTSFRVNAQARGYEQWGAPKDGCQSFTTGQWDNIHPVNRMTIDVTITNSGSQAIRSEDLNVALYNSAGTPLQWCVGTPVPTVLPRGSANYVFTTFVELNQFLSELRLSAFGATVRTCFTRNSRADATGCG